MTGFQNSPTVLQSPSNYHAVQYVPLPLCSQLLSYVEYLYICILVIAKCSGERLTQLYVYLPEKRQA